MCPHAGEKCLNPPPSWVSNAARNTFCSLNDFNVRANRNGPEDCASGSNAWSTDNVKRWTTLSEKCDSQLWNNAGWTQISDTIVKIQQSAMTYGEHQVACQRNGPGFQLAVLTTQNELDLYTKMAEDEIALTPFFVGLEVQRDADGRTSFFSSDGQRVNPESQLFRQWYGSELPTGERRRCLTFKRMGFGGRRPADADCDTDLRTAVCRGPSTAPYPQCVEEEEEEEEESSQKQTPKSSTSKPYRKKKPNIVIMLADDMGWGDMPDKTEELIMPNMEKMWKNGMRLNRMYASAPVCSPTRASVLTGMHPERHSVNNPNANGHHNDGDVRETFMKKWFTLPEALKLKCYKTGTDLSSRACIFAHSR